MKNKLFPEINDLEERKQAIIDNCLRSENQTLERYFTPDELTAKRN